ncbi:MAG: ribonuclease H-like domain-containing protein [Chloroflexi bacterium]|nr:ribonuclease H-like domain-containing protein [Chloroflexota bacterium]
MYWDEEAAWPAEGGPVPIEALVEGEERPTTFGPCFVARREFALSYSHGRFPLSKLLAQANGLASSLMPDAGLDGLDLRRALFMDIETTGLGLGGDTLVFLVGVGYFENGFQVEQYLVRRPAEELPMLDAVAARLSGCTGLVTFNGRSFDWPMLTARLSRNGFRVPGMPLHLDLLLPARRRWRGRLPSCSLASLEYHALMVERGDDVPGRRVPTLYWRYQRSGDGRIIRRVLEHNAGDILSMVTLASHLGGLAEEQEL